MMEPFERIDIQELPLSVPLFRRQVEDFLGSNGLRLEEVDLYMAVLSVNGAILAGGGLYRDIIKCIAVSEEARSLGLSVPLISRLVSIAADRGYTNVKVFTKPSNRAVFESLGFRVLAEAPQAILMENGRGLEDYCRYLRAHRADGVIVMNANPFTLGHRYLVEQASSAVSGGAQKEESGNLAVIPVKEDLSLFPYSERLEMIRSGCDGLADVVEGSDYQISAATFPTYFLKDLSDASETQMRLDIDLFGRHIAPALGATVRFVGSEPADPLTARYNALMKEMLPAYGVRVVEIRRQKGSNGRFIKASRVRELLTQGRYQDASALTPSSIRPYLLAFLAERALRMELDAPLKPGLVGPESNGAHKDMDYDLMRKGISAIRPFFPRMAQTDSPDELRQLGIDAEKAMLAATGGVNTHRGAIFALGLALNVICRISATGRRMENVDSKLLMRNAFVQLTESVFNNTLSNNELLATGISHGSEAVRRYRVKGAREMAMDGYNDLLMFWLPYYSEVKKHPFALQRTLVMLIASLDDTCIIHRVGNARSEELRDEAADLFGQMSYSEDYDKIERVLKALCDRYTAEGVSPGGAADMLALTLFMDSILH